MNYKKLIFTFTSTFPSLLFTATSNTSEVSLPLFSIIPFIGILLSIAMLPLINHHFWEKNFGKISAFWAILFALPFLFKFGFSASFYYFTHAMLLEYIPFIVLLLLVNLFLFLI